MEDHEEIGKALGKIPSGVGILTARHGTTESAMLASWFQQIAFEPPMIMISVKKERPIGDIIQNSRSFTLNLLHTDQKKLIAHFGKGFEPGQSPFEETLIMRKESGNAVITEAMAYLDCKLAGELDAGDHRLYLGHILEGGILNEGHPMVHMRRNGFRY
jgi:flavin reductase (DIM6/NTAB) family NADH-FMN oxidoreductase RutF